MPRLTTLLAAGLLAASSGCATISETNQQVLMVRTIQDNHEIGGVGCVLTNDAGRWFVTTPGHVTVQKSAGNLWVDCRKNNASMGQDVIASKANTSALVGTALTAGLGYLLDKRTGAGFDYPETLTVLMRRTGPGEAQGSDTSAGNAVY
ncbi:MAG: hypothetical protein ACLGI6_01795 [Gammaproteobacteria bacterium]